MKKIVENAFTIALGLTITAICVKTAYLERGYIAIGGEWLALPIMIVVKALLESIAEDTQEDW